MVNRLRSLNLFRSLPEDSGISAARGGTIWKRLLGGGLVVIGYLLSPLCWWNDLIFNLPVAYGIGYLCSLVSQDWLLPGAIVGYWLSNVVGILLMQAGVFEIAHNGTQERNFKKDLLSGLLTSTLYTAAILVFLQLGILDSPLSSETLAELSGQVMKNLNSFFPIGS
ncbi:hypothetical protein [Alkalinema sp. FACHB-956]|uniref:hypothetical protein n=1 Tax=Alkalinema sp. FACHB-956 TaxID=2692768 RepID=UPI0018EF710A|nr:hypothetical protein [Alkalinema sp. FACHB-956]